MVMLKIKRNLQNWLTKRLFCTILPNDVVKLVVDEKKRLQFIKLGDEQISNNEWKMLAEEVKCFEKMKLYSILFNTMGEQARQYMFENSKSDADMLWGKAILYTKDMEKQIMKALKQYR